MCNSLSPSLSISLSSLIFRIDIQSNTRRFFSLFRVSLPCHLLISDFDSAWNFLIQIMHRSSTFSRRSLSFRPVKTLSLCRQLLSTFRLNSHRKSEVTSDLAGPLNEFRPAGTFSFSSPDSYSSMTLVSSLPQNTPVSFLHLPSQDSCFSKAAEKMESFLEHFPEFPTAFLVGGPADVLVIELTDQVLKIMSQH